MTKPLDPELKAMRAIDRALADLPMPAQIRILEFMCARTLNLPGFDLDSSAKIARLAEALRWVRSEVVRGSLAMRDREAIQRLLDRALTEAESNGSRAKVAP
jgi:hypothetical protein